MTLISATNSEVCSVGLKVTSLKWIGDDATESQSRVQIPEDIGYSETVTRDQDVGFDDTDIVMMSQSTHDLMATSSSKLAKLLLIPKCGRLLAGVNSCSGGPGTKYSAREGITAQLKSNSQVFVADICLIARFANSREQSERCPKTNSKTRAIPAKDL